MSDEQIVTADDVQGMPADVVAEPEPDPTVPDSYRLTRQGSAPQDPIQVATTWSVVHDCGMGLGSYTDQADIDRAIEVHDAEHVRLTADTASTEGQDEATADAPSTLDATSDDAQAAADRAPRTETA